MEAFLQDLLYSLRTLRKQQSFSILAILVLAIGIGANTTIFTLVNALLLRPLPVKDPATVVGIYTSDFSGTPYGTSSYPDYLNFRAQTKTLSGIAACGITPVSVLLDGHTERIFVETVSGNYFSVLGIQTVLGGGFDSKEERPAGKSPVVVISHAMWVSRFHSDPQIVGRVISINGNPFTIIGVAAENFSGMMRGLAVSMWVPLAMQSQIVPGNNDLIERGGRSLFLFGRLKPGVKIEQARVEFAVIALQMHKQFPEQWSSRQNTPRRISVLPESASRIFPQARLPVIAFMAVLMVIVFIVLLVACANVANLLLVRAASRQKEIAIRLSLGAGRWRILRQLLTESFILSFLGAALGVLLAFWGTHLVMLLRPPVPVPIHLELSIDQRVLFFTVGLSVISGILFGLTPALQTTRLDQISALKNESGTLELGTGRTRLRNVITVAQLSLSLLLLIAALLCARSLRNAAKLNPGFDAAGILVASMDLNLQGYGEEAGLAFYRRLLDEVRQIPEVKSATYTKELPLAISSTRMSITIQDYKPVPGEDMELHTTWIGPDYFRTLEIPMLRGRGFADRDSGNSRRVAVVNQEFAKRYWPGQDPLGKQIRIGWNASDEEPSYEVIGVAKDSKYSYLGEKQLPFFYLSLFQRYESSVTLVLKTDQQPQRLIPVLRSTVQGLDRNLPLYDIKTMDQHLELALLPARFAGSALGIFGVFAWILATLGIYGVVSYMVTRRTREIGIRMAIGANQSDVLRLILSQGMRLTAMGVLIGIGVGLAVMRFLSFLLYDVSPTDPFTFVAVPLSLTVVALFAAYIPARRAARVNPIVALRYE